MGRLLLARGTAQSRQPACTCGTCAKCHGRSLLPSALPRVEALPAPVRAPMERAFGVDFGQVRIHADAGAAAATARIGAAAYTEGEHLHFAAGRYRPEGDDGRALIAHELSHVVQQRLPGPASGGAEVEAAQAAERTVRGEPVAIRQASNGVQRQNSPHNKMVVARARRRLAVLDQFEAEWTEREARRLRIAHERPTQLAARSELDRAAGESGADLPEAIAPGGRERTERELIAQLNRRPLRIVVSEDAVTFNVRFHIRFEDPAMADRASSLTAALQQGLDTVWNQPLSGDVFGGRRMRFVAETTVVAADAARDRNFWLITVRPADDAPIQYPGCALEQNNSGVPTSVTDATCDGGVMSIPPRHVTRSGVLGHELLHLLGLVDRYVNFVTVTPGGERINENVPTRDTPHRLDPLGAEDGPVLREDLAFLFDQLGVYDLEAARSRALLRRLEREGLTIGHVRGEMIRLQEIIDLGYDPRSLIRLRRDFNDVMIREAEDL